MSSSSLSHAGTTQTDGQVGSDPNHSPTMMMSQPPNHSGPIQSDPSATSYVTVHRTLPYGVPPGPEGYPHQHPHPHHHVVTYVSQGPPPPRESQISPPELMYAVDSPPPPLPTQNQSRPQPHPQAQEEEEEGSPPPPSASHTNGKRKQPDTATPDAAAKKRKQRAGVVGVAGATTGDDGEEAADLEVGPNGGAKHWTEEEKTRFFTWMLASDEHWDAFRTRMNTVFRESSADLFPGRKSYTALKSCYHRNLEVFKQIHAFQAFSANHFRQIQSENPNVEQPPVETVLEMARVAGLNVGSLSVKVIDRWYETGWFDLFKRRYREDPKTGLPIAYFGSSNQHPEPGPSSGSHAMMGLHPAIDPQLTAGQSGHPSQEMQYAAGEGSQSASSIAPGGSYPYSPPPSQSSDYRQAGPSTVHQPPAHQFGYLRSSSSLPGRLHHPPPVTPTSERFNRMNASNGQRYSPNPEQSGHDHYAGGVHPQMAQALSQLTTVTESLLGVCTSLKELLEQQLEESKARTELMRVEMADRIQNGGEGGAGTKEKEISIEKVTFATQILKSGPENEEIKKAAIECLTKYLMRDL